MTNLLIKAGLNAMLSMCSSNNIKYLNNSNSYLLKIKEYAAVSASFVKS